jgi:hypothetical protein
VEVPSPEPDAYVAAGPDGRSWAYVDCCPAAGDTSPGPLSSATTVVVVGGPGGERRFGDDPAGGYWPEYALAWTAEGVWIGRQGGVDLLDPATGRSRPVLELDRGVRLRSMGADLAAGARTVAAAEPPSPRTFPVGAAVAGGLLAAVVAVALQRRYRTRRMRAMQTAPAAASTSDTTKSAR